MGKYTAQANVYAGSVSSIQGILSNVISELDKVNSMLSLDADSSKDLLTFNVVSSNQEIKSEVSDLVSEITQYVGPLSAKAKELDEELENNKVAGDNTVKPSEFSFSNNRDDSTESKSSDIATNLTGDSQTVRKNNNLDIRLNTSTNKNNGNIRMNV